MTHSNICHHISLLLGLALFAVASPGCLPDESSLDQDLELRGFTTSGPSTTGPSTTGSPQFEDDLRGRWDFETSGLDDSTELWNELVLIGDATISDGALHVHGSGWEPTGWAYAPGYSGPNISDKTLVAWVTLDDLGTRNGAVLSINNNFFDQFDSIGYAGQQQFRWMAGSSYFMHTENVVTVNETALNEMVQMGIAYREVDSNVVEITICRNGEELGKYEGEGLWGFWSGPGTTEALFGMTESDADENTSALEASIHEARIYGVAMSCSEIAGLEGP